ncbi:MAG: D-alanyl-D-alanine carboxypeptidase [Firmicutes bacterium]|nr:D-alanyl-D-alanine carboxypeptidase [Bacillota bacterium]MDH7495417.1 D-alanyl-D-alanine carboxypeptidase family protein [Bacillota bacterium]
MTFSRNPWRRRHLMLALDGVAAAFVMAAAALITSLSAQAAVPPVLKARSAVLTSAETGQILYEKEADLRVAPASITKVMTMLLAMEAVDSKKVSLDDMITTSTEASQIGGSQIWLAEGEQMRLGDMMKAIAIVSANDAAYAVSEFIAGSAEDFVDRMNEKARDLGMSGTHFQNPDGLPAPDHYTTARDIATMSRELVTKHPKVLEWTSTWTDSLERKGVRVRQEESFLRNTNELILRYPGADGLKTGMTDEAGYCLAGTAKRDDVRLISVVMGLPTNQDRIEDTIKLLNYGFREFDRVAVAKRGEVVGEVRVPNGRREDVPAAVSTNFVVFVDKGKKDFVETAIVSLERRAPIRQGEKLGAIVASLEGREIARVDVVAAEDVPRANIFTVIVRAIRDFFRNVFRLGK